MATGDFVLLLVFLVISGGLLVSLVYLEDFISPKVSPSGMGRAAVESAERPFHGSRLVGFQYYLYAIIFVVIEALLVFLLLWGESVSQLGITTFVGVGVGLLYTVLLIRYLLGLSKNII